MNHAFVGKREYGLQPAFDDKCVKCDVRYGSHASSSLMVDEEQLKALQKKVVDLQRANIDMATKVMISDLDRRAAEQRIDLFRSPASMLYDIKGWLRLCEDTPEGHAEFYAEACKLVWPDQYPEPSEDDDAEYPPSVQDGHGVSGQGQAGQ